MKILHITSSILPGAGNAVSRLNIALNKFSNFDSKILYMRPFNRKNGISKFEKNFNSLINIICNKIFGNLSFNYFPSTILKKINKSDADIIHLHWINAEMISVKQISKIDKPIVWTFHDMWPFCGIEHYTFNDYYKKIIRSSGKSNKNTSINKFFIFVKSIFWKNNNFHIIAPSNWIANCARESILFEKNNISVVANCLDLNIFKISKDKNTLRKKFNIPLNHKVILFGAAHPNNHRKGIDLLYESIIKLKEKIDISIVIFGTKEKSTSTFNGIKVFELGSFYSDNELSEIYNIANVVCIPSRQDNLPSLSLEANSCGIPVVAFKVSGFIDLIDHNINGYLAKPYDVNDFARGISWALNEDENIICLNCRNFAKDKFSEEKIAKEHVRIYNNYKK